MNSSFLTHYPGLHENENRVYCNFNILLFLALLDITVIGLGLLQLKPAWPFYACVAQFGFFICMLILHIRGFFVLARFATFLLTIALQTVACIAHGERAGFDLVFFIIGILPILFFDDRRFYAALFLITLITQLSVQYVYAHYEPLMELNTNIPLYWNIFVTASLIFLVIHLFKQGYLTTQKSLQDYNERILRQKEEIELINNNLELLVKDRTHKILEHEKLFIEFANINAHRVRSPLARILGLLKVIDLETHQRSQTIEEMLPVIQKNAEELNTVLKEVDVMLNSANLLMDRK